MRLLAICCTLFGAASAYAQPATAGIGVPVRIWGTASGAGEGDFTISGTFLPTSPTDTGYETETAVSTDPNGTQLDFKLPRVNVAVGRSYTVYMTGSYWGSTINITSTPGYAVTINNQVRTKMDLGGSIPVTFMVRRTSDHPGVAGMISTLSTTGIDLRISLGTLRNGGSAGELVLSSPGLGDSFEAPKWTYESSAPDVEVTYGNGMVTRVVANQVTLDVVSGGGWLVDCYYPPHDSTLQYPGLGEKFAAYEIASQSATQWLIRRKLYTQPGSMGYNELKMLVTRTGTWPNFTWTKTGWCPNTYQPSQEIVTTVTSSTGTRTESTTVAAPSSSPGFVVSRTYTDLASGEMLTSESWGSTNPQSRSFAYYTDYNEAGSFGQLKSAVLPGGNWVGFEYYPTTLATGTLPAGLIKYRFKPYLNSPSSPQFSPTQGEVTYYEYGNASLQESKYPTLVETKVNGVVTSRVTYVYTVIQNYGGAKVLTIVKAEGTDSARTLQTTSTVTEEHSGFIATRGSINPDGTRYITSTSYGRWSDGLFVDDPYGRASVVTTLSGVGTSGADTSAYQANQTPAIFPVIGKSIYQKMCRNNHAQTYKEQQGVWTTSGPAYNVVPETVYLYDGFGQLLSKTGGNGAVDSATFSAGLKTTETDKEGIKTEFTYDGSGRLASSKRTAFETIGSMTVNYGYDVMDRVTSEQSVGWDGTSLTTSRQFDDAGRLTSETPAGLGTTSHTYDEANRIHTTTRPDGSTIVETNYLDGRPASKTGSGVVAEYYTYGIESDGRKWQRVDIGTSSSTRWKKSWTDWVGRPLREESPGVVGQPTVVTENTYDNASGWLLTTTKTGYAPTKFVYDRLGKVIRSGLDIDSNGLVVASNDRISETEEWIESVGGSLWARKETRSYYGANSGVVTVDSVVRNRLSGFPTNRVSETQTIDAEGNITTESTDVIRDRRTVTKTTTKPGHTLSQIERKSNGLITYQRGLDGLVTTFAYDGLGRMTVMTDARGNQSTTTYYSNSPLKQSTKDGTGQIVASYGYDALGRVVWQSDALNYVTRTSFTLRGQVHRQWGSGTYPVEFGYETTFGDKTTQSTFRGGSGWDGASWPGTTGTADTTTWGFDTNTGSLVSKTDPQGRTVTQTYNLRGQTVTTTLARGVVTTYSYDSQTGDLLGTSYSDGVTPSVTYTYGRRGAIATVADGAGTRTFGYDSSKPWRLNSEALGSYYGGRHLTYLYEGSGAIGRSVGFQVGAALGSNSDYEALHGYSSDGRVETVRTGFEANSTLRTFRYGFEPNAPLLKSLTIDGNSNFAINRTYETQRDLLTSIETKWGAAVRTKHAYTYDQRMQRSAVIQSGEAYADYGDATQQRLYYNGRGELTAAIGYLGSSLADPTTALPGRRFEYAYDSIGNRQSSNRTGVSGLQDDYVANSLNQYVSRENNIIPVSGSASTTSVVAVTSRNVTAGRKGKFWSDEVVVNNMTAAWAGPISVYAAKPNGGSGDLLRLESRTGQIPAQAQTFSYDLDGNLLSDGVWNYQWDGENRLIRMETTTAARSNGYAHRILEFKYDSLHRRIQKRVLDGGTSAELSSRRFLYQGWNLVLELAAPGGNSVGVGLRSYFGVST